MTWIFAKMKFGATRCLVMGLVFLLVLPTFLLPLPAFGEEVVDLGGWSREKIDRLLADAGRIPKPGDKVEFISAAFLETPYLAGTLIGSAETAEVFVLRLDGVDCFTLLDYVEALRRASDFERFKEALRRVRYREERVDFFIRNHFFSEWGEAGSGHLREATALVGEEDVRRGEKQLNGKEEGTLYLPGYPVRKRQVAFIPPEAVDESVLARLRSGDYVGIYTPLPGLDVSHCGIVVKRQGKVFLRHASSRLKKVTDEELASYLGGKKGLVVYRPL
ncbi:N-acetylmuramoyl-L-alanine amidase-like domain-containing protein [Desulfuromonas sp. TF]|uniref:N-acetylmuramoyl-L-alanine amidase-like domain-containing protein n=1 Tax=Desulfuromonas sp. TF TaxID=1232410 RepID=UPI00040340D2|nr:N-acetylmuramoyl-L-alanine amidase-like domain-containing protein [Desulfuromonas sp. TF]